MAVRTFDGLAASTNCTVAPPNHWVAALSYTVPTTRARSGGVGFGVGVGVGGRTCAASTAGVASSNTRRDRDIGDMDEETRATNEVRMRT